MRLVPFLLSLFALSACTGTGYIMVSKGEASVLYRAFVGGVDYCKVTQENLEGVEFSGEIEYDGENCIVSLSAASTSAGLRVEPGGQAGGAQ